MFAPKIIKIYQSFFKLQSIMSIMFFDIFLFISMHILLIQFFPGSAETDIEWGGKMACNLMASCARNIYAKNY